MNQNDLLRIIRDLPSDTPVHRELEHAIGIGVEYGRAWYSSQQEHWIGWLSSYHLPGAYKRKDNLPQTHAKAIYNRLMCPPMVLWLPEAAGVPTPVILAAFEAAFSTSNHATQCAAIRRNIPWEMIEQQLAGSCN